MQNTVQNQPDRSYALDVIKISATIFILFHHYQQVGQVIFDRHINFFSETGFSWSLMVELFFIISGFVMHHYCDGRLQATAFPSFMAKRMLRLLPPVFISAFVYFALNFLYQRLYGHGWFFYVSANLWGAVVSALGLQTGWGLNGYLTNNPMWYVSVLLLCYCIFYLATYLSQRFRFPSVYAYLFILVLCFGGLRAPLFTPETVRGYRCFFFGLLLGLFYRRYTLNKRLVLLCCAILFVMLAFFLFASYYIDIPMAFTYLFCPALVLLTQTKTAAKVFCHRFWKTLSEISYHVFVWHSPLQLLLYTINETPWKLANPLYMYLFAALAWAVGTVSWLLIDGILSRKLPGILASIFEKRKSSTPA